MTRMRTGLAGWAAAAACGALGAALLLAPSTRAAEDVIVAEPESAGMSSERLARIDGFIQEYIDSDRIAGAVTLVARQGKVVHFEAQGWRDKENGVPMTKDTIFVLMSMTKPIVSTALMMLFEEGRFLLDDPISKWIPEYENHTVRINADGVRPQVVPEARPVTVRHVLTHTSGLTLNPQGKGLSQEQINHVTNHGQGWPTLAERVAHAAVIPGAFHPGDEWQYGDSTDHVAVLVEKISGKSLDDFLRERIFEPLGMADTYYYVPREKVERMASVYRPDENGKIALMVSPEYREPTRMFRGVAGLAGTAADYYRFAQMIANGGELEGTRLLGRMTVDKHDQQPHRRRSAGLHPRWRLRLRPRLRGADQLGGGARRAVHRQLHLGRGLRHALLGRSGRGSHRHPDDPDSPVQPPEHPPPVLQRRHTGGGRQPGGSEAADHGASDAALRARETDSVTRPSGRRRQADGA